MNKNVIAAVSFCCGSVAGMLAYYCVRFVCGWLSCGLPYLPLEAPNA
jgi:hypothetical protein